MKKMRLLPALLLVLCLLPGAAAATEDAQAPVSIQLNGQTMALPSGVQPWIDPDSGRTYVPFRDVFEAMGAAVDYNADTRAVTAVRGDVTVAFSQDAMTMTITTGDETVSLDMDAPPITREGRILVPVRFASQALGAKVGWDSSARTVLVADIPTLVQERLGSYEILGKLQGLLGIDATRNHQLDMELDALVDLSDLLGYGAEGPVPIRGQLSAIAGPQGIDATGSVTADVSAMLAAVPGMSGNVTMTYDAQAIWNQKTGMLYLQSPAIAQSMGLGYYGLENMEAWLGYDVSEADEMIHALGIGLLQPIADALMGGQADWTAVAAQLLEQAAGSVYLYSINSYESILEAVDTVNRLLEDSFFVLEDGVWVNRFSLDDDGLAVQLAIGVAVDEQGTATGCTVHLEMGDDYNTVAAQMDMSANALQLSVALTSEITMAFDLAITWAPTDAKPRTEPPKGEEIVDPMALQEAYYNDIFERYAPTEPEPEPKAV